MKDLLISHVKDVDGVSPVILMKLANRDFVYKLLDIYEVEDYFNELLNTNLSIYENIYVVDLTVPEVIYEKLDKYKDKVKVFDHHESHMYAKDKDYVTLDINECGTTLFYKYLDNLYNIANESVDTYIKAVKDLDLWTYKENNNEYAKTIGTLFILYGKEIYIDEIFNHLKNNDLTLTEIEEKMIKLEYDREKSYIEHKVERMFKVKINNLKAGLVFAEKYRNELSDYMLNNFEIDFAIIVNSGGGISLRSRDDIDVEKIARIYGGGGHKNASGLPVTIDMQKEFIKILFEGCELIEDK